MSHDTRVYSTPRLKSFHGYEDPPLVDDGFQWKLPAGDRYYGREVEFGGRRYELWSRNSLQDPYFPGYRPRATSLQQGHSLEQRRYDGQLGRFDPTISPQTYDPRRPWLGFMTVPFHPAYSDSPENERVMDVWISEPDSGYRGRLRPLFLKRLADANTAMDAAIRLLDNVRYSRPQIWDDRPRRPWSTDFDLLTKIERYENAVDTVRELQRGILEKTAWLRMAIAWRDKRGSVENMRKLPILPACDEYMGVWMHGIPEEEMLFFLTCAGVPCYLMHELTAEEPRGEMVTKTFTEATIVNRFLDPYSYEVDRLALTSNGGKFTALEITIAAVMLPARGLELRTCSSSRWQLGLTSDDPVPSCRALLVRLADAEKAEPDDKEESSISLGSENNEGPDVSSPGVPNAPPAKKPPPARPVVPTLTFPGMESTVITAVLKFPGLPDSFTPADFAAWLTAAGRVVPGCEWRVMYLHQRKPRVDYFVEFESAEAALKVKGLINPKEGEVREGVFVGPTEYGEVKQKLAVVLEQTAPSIKHDDSYVPYAGGRYLRQEPPSTSHLPKTSMVDNNLRPLVIPPPFPSKNNARGSEFREPSHSPWTSKGSYWRSRPERPAETGSKAHRLRLNTGGHSLLRLEHAGLDRVRPPDLLFLRRRGRLILMRERLHGGCGPLLSPRLVVGVGHRSVPHLALILVRDPCELVLVPVPRLGLDPGRVLHVAPTARGPGLLPAVARTDLGHAPLDANRGGMDAGTAAIAAALRRIRAEVLFRAPALEASTALERNVRTGRKSSPIRRVLKLQRACSNDLNRKVRKKGKDKRRRRRTFPCWEGWDSAYKNVWAITRFRRHDLDAV
ncbi:hypothetical protein B0H13DRAFT_2315174 [Mycena leptocephala]|nr:hypothetical protein B0H13DRAFT_2315174 [Mycena leptocephala]